MTVPSGAMQGQQPQQGQPMQPPPDPSAQWAQAILEPRVTDEDPTVAKVRYYEIRRFIESTDYTKLPPGARQVVDAEYQRMAFACGIQTKRQQYEAQQQQMQQQQMQQQQQQGQEHAQSSAEADKARAHEQQMAHLNNAAKSESEQQKAATQEALQGQKLAAQTQPQPR